MLIISNAFMCFRCSSLLVPVHVGTNAHSWASETLNEILCGLSACCKYLHSTLPCMYV